MIVLIDNYDSFSYNLYQLLGSIEPEILVVRNDALTVDELAALGAQALVISPGPGRPADAGICEDAIRALSGTLPILGVCLGHQAIVEAFGGVVTYAEEIMHGKADFVRCEESPLFAGIEQPMQVARYHSLEAEPASLAATPLRAIASNASGEVMAVQHETHPTFGLQFHPESILTPEGAKIAQNFMDIARARA